MYGVIRRHKLDPANFDESVRRVEQGFVSKISASPGFVSYRVLRADNGDALSVSVFDSREQAEDSAKTAAGWVRENLAELMPNPPEVTAGEVLLREVNSQEELHYGVMRRYKTDADVREIVRRAQSGFVPIVSKLSGFASYVIMDAGVGPVVSLSGFRDQASADKSTQEAASWVRDNLAELVPNPPEITRAEAKISRVRLWRRAALAGLATAARGGSSPAGARYSSLIVTYPSLPGRPLPGAIDEPLFGQVPSAPTGQLPQAARIVARSVTVADAVGPACWGIAAGSLLSGEVTQCA